MTLIAAAVHDLVWKMAERAGHKVASIRTERDRQNNTMLIRINTVNGSTIALHYPEPSDDYRLSEVRDWLVAAYPNVFGASPAPAANLLTDAFKRCFERIDQIREDLELARKELADLKLQVSQEKVR
jgi:hypothetical protein